MNHSAVVNFFVLGIFDDEEKVLQATQTVRQQGFLVHDVYTPYAVHGLDEAMGLKRSRLPIVCFVAGFIGCVFAVLFQSWIFTSNWPMNIGGKPFFALPAFIPVTFEITILVGGLVSVFVFFLRSKLYPGADLFLLDEGITDDKFVIAIKNCDASVNFTELENLFKKLGANDVKVHGVES